MFDSRTLSLFLIVLLAAVCVLFPEASHAAADPNCTAAINSNFTEAQCTDALKCFDQQMDPTGMMAQIVRAIKTIMNNVGQSFYEKFIGSTKFWAVVNSMFVIYVASYGIVVLLQIAPLSMAEMFSRVAKMAIVYFLFASWANFGNYFANAFFGLMDTLIGKFLSFAVQHPPDSATDAGSSDFFMKVLGSPLKLLMQSKFFIAFWSMLTSGFSGFGISLVLGWTFVTLLRVIIGGLITYLKAIIILNFLFGIAPMFFLFILFEETRRKVFQGWINQVVSITIQPILFFAFIGFFFVLINATISNVMNNFEACQVKTKMVEGSGYDMVKWQASMRNANTHDMEPYAGDWANFSAIDWMGILLVWLLTELAWRFSKYVDDIGADIAGGATLQTVKARDVSNFLKSFHAKPGG